MKIINRFIRNFLQIILVFLWMIVFTILGFSLAKLFDIILGYINNPIESFAIAVFISSIVLSFITAIFVND